MALEAVSWEPPPPDPALVFSRGESRARESSPVRGTGIAWLPFHTWREQEAASRDVPPFRILRSEALLALASNPPADLEALGAVPGVGRSTARRYGREMMKVLTQPPPAPAREPRQRARVDREREGAPSSRRGRQGTPSPRGLGLEPGILAPRSALELVVDRRPRTEEGLLTCLCKALADCGCLGSALLALVAGLGGGGVRHPCRAGVMRRSCLPATLSGSGTWWWCC